MHNKNPTIAALQPHIGAVFTTQYRFYLNDKKLNIAARDVVVLLDVCNVNKYYAEIDSRAAVATSDNAGSVWGVYTEDDAKKAAFDKSKVAAAAYLLFQNGIARWSYLWQGVAGFDDCLKLIKEVL